jgi:hypothetical protein
MMGSGNNSLSALSSEGVVKYGMTQQRQGSAFAASK